MYGFRETIGNMCQNDSKDFPKLLVKLSSINEIKSKNLYMFDIENFKIFISILKILFWTLEIVNKHYIRIFVCKLIITIEKNINKTILCNELKRDIFIYKCNNTRKKIKYYNILES